MPHETGFPTAPSGTYTPTPLKSIHYGPSVIKTHLLPSIRSLLAQTSGQDEDEVKPKVMIVTGRSLMEKTPVIKEIEGILRDEGWWGLTFSDIAQHAPVKDIKRAQQLVLDNEINLLLSVGGGSPIDSVKAIAHFVKEETKSDRYLPHIAIPTTLSVAETTQNAGYTSETGEKSLISSPSLPPSIILYDPLPTIHTPLHLFLSTGIRALDHAVETLYRPGVTKGVRDMALWAIRGLMRGIYEVRELTQERERKGGKEAKEMGEQEVRVRGELMVDAWESLWPLASAGPLGLSHALGHRFGATYSIPHGTCSCLTLSTSVKHLAPHLEGINLGYLAMALAFVPSQFLPSKYEGKSISVEMIEKMSVEEKREAATAVGESIGIFLEKVGLKTGLGEWDVPKRDLKEIGDKVVQGLGAYNMPKEQFEEVVRIVLDELSIGLKDQDQPSKKKEQAHPQEKDRFPLGTRASQLALIQAHHVAQVLGELHPGAGYSFPVTPMSVAGDRNKKDPLYLLTNGQAGTGTGSVEGMDKLASTQIAKSLWTEELEQALMEKKLDVIVHCLKDMPTQLPDFCEIGAILEREDPHDALVVKKGLKYRSLGEMPEGSVVGTSSVRRIAQIRKSHPGLKVMDVRGNLDTRLKKLDDPNGPFTAIILAAAGMNRMGWQDRITAVIKAPEMLYAVGQGALALEIRSGDERVKTALQDVGNWKSEWSTAAERGLLRELEGGCSVPVGVEAFIEEVDEAASKSINRPFDKNPEAPSDTAPLLHRSGKGKMAKLHMTACVTSLDGKTQVLHDAGEILVKSYLEADSWGHKVALTLKEKGATSILDEINQLRKEREKEAALAQGEGSQ